MPGTSADQIKVMSAIERCRTGGACGPSAHGLSRGGHVARCEDCADTVIAYNGRNAGCPVSGNDSIGAVLAARDMAPTDKPVG